MYRCPARSQRLLTKFPEKPSIPPDSQSGSRRDVRKALTRGSTSTAMLVPLIRGTRHVVFVPRPSHIASQATRGLPNVRLRGYEIETKIRFFTPPVLRTMSSTPNGTANTCGGSNNHQDDYNKPLHVGALFVIMAVSTLAAIFPLIATRVQRLRVPQKGLFVIKHFGTGVLMSVTHLSFPFTGTPP